jgi:hypothetical protein
LEDFDFFEDGFLKFTNGEKRPFEGLFDEEPSK